MGRLSHLAATLLMAANAIVQAQQAPIPATMPLPAYPPIAKAAHVRGDVVASFSIDAEGRPASISIVSGHPMLRGSVTRAIEAWRFRIPLPVGAQTSFVATMTFGGAIAEEADSLDFPPDYPCCGQSIPFSESVATKIVSLDGSQSIALPGSRAASSGDTTAAQGRCAGDTNVQPPTTSADSDFVELARGTCEAGCSNYLVRVYRNGRVEWTGLRSTVAAGPRQSQISLATADMLLERFAGPAFWGQCSMKPAVPEVNPERPDPEANDSPALSESAFAPSGIQLTASMGGHTKTLDVSVADGADDFPDQRLAWAVDRAADTHRWRHFDAAGEPLGNMALDFRLPKAGITLLMRAIYRLRDNLHGDDWLTLTDPVRLAPLKRLLATEGNPNAADESGWTALMYQAWLLPSDAEVTRLLLAANADPNQRSRHGDTALIIGAHNGSLNPLLLAAHADINAANADGTTLLMVLARYEDSVVLQQALAAGADPTAQDNRGRTALDYLAEGACMIAPKPVPCPPLSPAYAANLDLLRQAIQTWKPR